MTSPYDERQWRERAHGETLQRAEKAEARIADYEALAEVVRKLCRNAVPQWAPELRAALAKVDASAEKK